MGTMPVVALVYSTYSAMQFVLYNYAGPFQNNYGSKQQPLNELLPIQYHALAGSCAAIAAAPVLAPADRIKILLQMSESSMKSKVVNRSVLGIIKNVIKKDGVKGLFRGVLTTMIRDIPGRYIYRRHDGSMFSSFNVRN